MPPKHNPDTDFSDLSDRILELLLVVWTFITDLSTALWSYLCQVFWTVWTWPPFETFRNEFVAALVALKEYTVDHPITTIAIVILAYVVIPVALNAIRMSLLHCLGYRRQGVLRGSYAANYQSTSYGGNVPRGSTFAQYQSQGARGGSGYRGTGGTSPSWD